jgi:hypothetical protein
MESSRVEDLIQTVLDREFQGEPTKQKIYKAGNRLNFSCPYCGDSRDGRKKRGNFYLNTLSYKCYNGGCGVFKDMYNILKDFKLMDKIDQDERNDILTVLQDRKEKKKTYYSDIDISLFFEEDIKKYVIPREDLMQKLNLKNVGGSKIEIYLTRRNQIPDEKFAWDPAKQRLYIFNLSREGNIIGLQFRNMQYGGSSGSKYYTYKLSGIWEKLLGCNDEKFLEGCKKIDPISTVFNIGKISFDETITIFEGPMDSFLWKNSVALCSVENRFPFEMENIQFWYDWDGAGRSKSSELLVEGNHVFNWKKFLDDHQIPTNKKWDLNDLVNFLRNQGLKIKRFENYFTEEVLDLKDFIDV